MRFCSFSWNEWADAWTSERTIFASIARVGFPLAAPALLDSSKKKKTRKLKSVVTAVVFAARIR